MLSRYGKIGVVGEPWNINIHYDAALDRVVPAGTQSVLDVGCGDGFLAARLSRRIPNVVALDNDEPVLRRAKARFADAPVTWRHGDVLDDTLQIGSFDAVVSNAVLHHLGATTAALRRLGSLVRPGGVLGVVGFVRHEWRELPWEVSSFLARSVVMRVHRKWEHTAPQLWPPPDTYRGLRAHSTEVLPGVHVSRLHLGRYLLYWRKPAR